MEVKRGEAGLEPHRTSPEAGTGASSPQPPPQTGATEQVTAKPNGTEPVTGHSWGGQPLPADGKRVVGLNYVVVQSYPDRKSAEEARDVLIHAGIPATVEQKLRGLNPSWFMVVGTEGFERVKSGPYLGYEKRIRQLSDGFAKKKSFKAFEPLPYKWSKSDP